jgi:hypothetical protein
MGREYMNHNVGLRGQGGRPTSTTGVLACFLFSAESRPQNVWVGLLARRCRACSAAASPSPAIAEWSFEAASSLTVAGPRRIHTGLPCYAPRGHPDKNWVISRPNRPGQSLVHLTGAVSSLPALRFPRILPIFSVIAPCREAPRPSRWNAVSAGWMRNHGVTNITEKNGLSTRCLHVTLFVPIEPSNPTRSCASQGQRSAAVGRAGWSGRPGTHQKSNWTFSLAKRAVMTEVGKSHAPFGMNASL